MCARRHNSRCSDQPVIPQIAQSPLCFRFPIVIVELVSFLSQQEGETLGRSDHPIVIELELVLELDFFRQYQGHDPSDPVGWRVLPGSEVSSPSRSPILRSQKNPIDRTNRSAPRQWKSRTRTSSITISNGKRLGLGRGQIAAFLKLQFSLFEFSQS